MKNKEKQYFIFYSNSQQIIFQDESINEIEKQVDNNLKEQPNNIDHLTIKEQIIFKYHNNYSDSLKIIRKILQKDKLNIDARLDLIMILLVYQFEYKNKIEDLIQECFKINENYWRTHFVEIRFKEENSIPDFVLLKKMEQLLLKFPENLQLALTYYQIYSDNYQLEGDKLSQFKMLSNREDQDFDLKRKIAYIYFNLEEIEKSRQLLESSLKMNPNSFYVYENLAYLNRVGLRDDEKCIQYSKMGLKQNPKSKIGLINLGISYRNLTQYFLSNIHLHEALEVDKNYIILYNKIVYNYYDLNQMEKAIYFAKKASNKFQKNQESHYLYQRIISKQYNQQILDEEEFEQISIKALNLQEQQDYQFISESLNDNYL